MASAISFDIRLIEAPLSSITFVSFFRAELSVATMTGEVSSETGDTFFVRKATHVDFSFQA
jgi:hypothetical protein